MSEERFYKHYGYFAAYEKEGWLELHHLIPLPTLGMKRAAMRAYGKMNHDIKRDRLEGWMTGISALNKHAIWLVLRLGAQPYAHNDEQELIYFAKEVSSDG